MSQPAKRQQAFTVTHRSVLAIAVPMTLAYLSTPLLGIVDTAVIGQLDNAAFLGGIALGSIIFDIVFLSFNFLRSGTTALTAQAFGANDDNEIKATFVRALVVAFAAGFLGILLQAPVIAIGLHLLGGSPEVQDATSRYLTIRVYSAPFLLANYAILGWLLGLGRANTGLLLQLCVNGLNMLLSVLFVLEFNWSIEGVAIATVMSEAVVAIGGLLLILRQTRKTPWPGAELIFAPHLLMRMFGVNRDIMIRSFALLTALGFFSARSADQGDIILAANTILDKFFLVSGYFLDGLATAVEQLTGRAIGARLRSQFSRAIRISALWSIVLASVLMLLYFIAGPSILDFMTVVEDVRSTGRTYLFWASITPLCGVLAFLMDGVFIGATWSRDMRNMMLVSLAAFIGLYYILFPLMGNHGLWLALDIFLILRGFTLWLLYDKRLQTAFPGQN